MMHENNRIIEYIQDSDSDWAKSIKASGNWMLMMIQNTADNIADLRSSMAQPFKDLAKTIQLSMDQISGDYDIGARIDTAQSEFKALDSSDTDYLSKAQELTGLIIERYNIEKSEIENIQNAFQGLADSVSGQLLGMQTSSDNPADIFERLGIQKDEVTRLKGLYGSSTGVEKAGFGVDLASALGDYLKLSQEAFQRPSSEYQAIFDMVTSELRMIQASALEEVSYAETQLIDLQTKTVTELSAIKTKILTSATALDGIRTASENINNALQSVTRDGAVKTRDQRPESNVFNTNITVNGAPEDSTDTWIDKIKYAIENGPLREPIQNVSYKDRTGR
jgi:hypothetical protein